MSAHLCIAHLVRHHATPSRALLARIKEKTVRKRFTASIIFAGAAHMRLLNHAYRKKSYTPNVLAFRLGKAEGEVFVCPSAAAREARATGTPPAARVAYLVIHGLLHLKGGVHSATMTQSEKRLCRFFKLPPP